MTVQDRCLGCSVVGAANRESPEMDPEMIGSLCAGPQKGIPGLRSPYLMGSPAKAWFSLNSRVCSVVWASAGGGACQGRRQWYYIDTSVKTSRHCQNVLESSVVLRVVEFRFIFCWKSHATNPRR